MMGRERSHAEEKEDVFDLVLLYSISFLPSSLTPFFAVYVTPVMY